MKIQVVIEATSIQEYTEAIQALAAGYTVQTPVINNVVVESAKTVDFDGVKEAIVGNDKTVKVEKPKSTRKAVVKAEETPKEEKSTATPKAEETVQEKTTETSDKESTVSFVDVKLKAKQHSNLPDGKADIKFVLDKLGAKKLSDLKENQYITFMNELVILEDLAKENIEITHDKESTPSDDVSESNGEAEDKVEQESTSKEVTIEMIRGRAKQVSVQGGKEAIREMLKAYGAPSLTKLAKDHYEDFYAELGNL